MIRLFSSTSCSNRSLEEGRCLDAILESRVVRLRPILLTAGAALLSAISHYSRSNFLRPRLVADFRANCIDAVYPVRDPSYVLATLCRNGQRERFDNCADSRGYRGSKIDAYQVTPSKVIRALGGRLREPKLGRVYHLPQKTGFARRWREWPSAYLIRQTQGHEFPSSYWILRA